VSGAIDWRAGPVEALATRIQAFLRREEPFTYCVAQIYGKDVNKLGIAPHVDEEQAATSPIVGLSLFERADDSRPLDLISGDFRKANRVAHAIDLHHGSIYVLWPPTNAWWKHGLKNRVSPRVSFTFRRHSGEAPSARRLAGLLRNKRLREHGGH